MAMAPSRQTATAASSVVRPSEFRPLAGHDRVAGEDLSPATASTVPQAAARQVPAVCARYPATAPISATRMNVRRPAMPGLSSSALRFSRSTPTRAPISSAVAKSRRTPRSSGSSIRGDSTRQCTWNEVARRRRAYRREQPRTGDHPRTGWSPLYRRGSARERRTAIPDGPRHGYHGSMAWLARDPDRRASPDRLWPGADSHRLRPELRAWARPPAGADAGATAAISRSTRAIATITMCSRAGSRSSRAGSPRGSRARSRCSSTRRRCWKSRWRSRRAWAGRASTPIWSAAARLLAVPGRDPDRP